jgi:hypothetical protein
VIRLLASLFALAALAVPAAAGAVNPPELFPGNYVQVSPVTKKPLEVGSSIVLVRSKSGKMGFSVNAIRALDSNQGFIAGTFAPGSKVVWAKQSEAGNCKLTFTAIPGGLTVVQDMAFGDCGFGSGVTAEGTYRWTGAVGSPKT